LNDDHAACLIDLARSDARRYIKLSDSLLVLDLRHGVDERIIV
jgi:hypothetical protein